MADKGCLKRLQKEYHALCKVSSSPLPGPLRFESIEPICFGFGGSLTRFVALQEPPPQIVARPLPNDILEWRK
jgi:ubiquitin-conjugating enzyme E2 J2